MHLSENSARSSRISVVALRGKDKVMGKFWVPVETPDAGYNFATEKLQALIANNEILALKCRASGKPINDLVKPFGIVIREP